MKTLRADQTEAIANLRDAMMDAECEHKEHGKPRGRIVLSGPTGVGKTVIISDIVNRARGKDNKVLITVPAVSLVDQTVEALYAQGIEDVGVIQAQHPMTDWSRPVQVASVQTLQHRWKERKMPKADIVLVDEVHRMFEMFSNWMPDPEWQKVPFIGFSATPWSKGLGVLYDRLVLANNIRTLIKAKVLVPFRTFAPDAPDLSGVRESMGDFVAKDLDEVMRPKTLVANIVETWKEKAIDRPTVCFCCSRAHADQMTKEFTEAGVGAAYLDCDSPLTERKEVRRRMLNGDVQVVCNVDVIGLGVDWVEVSCIVYARPTMSDIRFVQNIGRGLRAAPGKEDLLILDHSTTTMRLGFVDEIYDYHPKLHDGKTKSKAEYVLLPKECPACHLLKPPRVAVCPHCGHKVEAHIDPVKCERGTLREITLDDEDPMTRMRKRLPDKAHVLGQLIWWARYKGWKDGWAFHKYRAIYDVKYVGNNIEWKDKVNQPVRELSLVIGWLTNESKREWVNQRRREGYRSNGNGHGNGHDSGALNEREQAIIDRVAEQAKGTLITEQDYEDFR